MGASKRLAGCAVLAGIVAILGAAVLFAGVVGGVMWYSAVDLGQARSSVVDALPELQNEPEVMVAATPGEPIPESDQVEQDGQDDPTVEPVRGVVISCEALEANAPREHAFGSHDSGTRAQRTGPARVGLM